MAFGDPNHIDHLILVEDRGHRHCLLQPFSGPVHLLCYCAPVQLNLHDVGLFLSQVQQAHLHRETQTLSLRMDARMHH